MRSPIRTVHVVCLSCLLMALTTAATIAGPRLSGRVVGARGIPLIEADVALHAARPAHDLALAALAGDPDPVPILSVKTRADGRYVIETPGAGSYWLRVSAPGYAPQDARLEIVVEDAMLADVELVADGGLEVLVASADGKPVANALVRVDPAAGAMVGWSSSVFVRKTDAEGKVRVPLARGETAALAVASAWGIATTKVRGPRAMLALKPSRTRAVALVDREGRPVPLAIALHPRERLPVAIADERGRVVVPLGEAESAEIAFLAPHGGITGLRITTRREGEPEYLPVTIEEPTRVVGRVIDMETRKPIAGAVVHAPGPGMAWSPSDASGRFEFVVPRAIGRGLSAAAPGYLEARLDPIASPSKGLLEGTFALRPAAAVAGRVIDRDGRPVPRALVTASDRDAGDERPGMRRLAMRMRARNLFEKTIGTIAGEDGRFVLRGLDPDELWKLDAEAEDRGSGTLPIERLRPRETRADAIVTLLPTRMLTGRVVDNEGTPLAEAEIALSPANEGGGFFGRFGLDDRDDLQPIAFSRADGGFVAQEIAPGTYDVRVRRVGYARHEVPGVEVKDVDDKTELGDVTLEPGVSVFGSVIDASGAPVAGAEIQIGGGAFLRMPRLARLLGDAEAISNASGGFVIPDLRRGESIGLVATKEGFVAGNAKGVTAGSGEPVTLTLTAASRVEGIVLDDDERPVARAIVTLASLRPRGGGRLMSSGYAGAAETLDDGTFTIEDAEPGRFQLMVSALGFLDPDPLDVTLEPAATKSDVRVMLTRGARIAGIVRGPDGSPLPGARVSPVGSQSDFRLGGGESSTTDGDGRYALSGIAPGKHSIEVVHRDAPRTVRDIEVRAGDNTLDITMDAGALLTGRVIAAGGGPLAEARVSASPAGSGRGGRSALSDVSGSFAIEGLSPGDYELRVDASGYVAPDPPPRVLVQAADTPPVEIALRRAGRITGTLIGLEPAELSDVTIYGRSERDGGPGTIASDGRYVIEDAAPGEWTIRGQLESGRVAEARVTLAPDAPEASVDLQFGSGHTLSGFLTDGGAPVAGVTIVLRAPTGSAYFGSTDQAGAFRFEGLASGRYELAASDWQLGASVNETLDIDGDREITLRFPRARISGRALRASDRSPIVGAAVVAKRVDGAQSRGTTPGASTRGDGTFSVERLNAGAWRLVATKDGYAAREFDINLADGESADDIVLELEATQGLSLRLVGETGAAAREARVSVIDGAGRSLVGGAYGAGENGVVFIDSVPAGTWQVVVQADGFAATEITATAPGPATPVTLRRPAAIAIEVGELVQAAPQDAWLTLTRSDGRMHRVSAWNGELISRFRVTGGRSQVDALEPGTWTATITAADGRTWSGTVEATVASVATLRL